MAFGKPQRRGMRREFQPLGGPIIQIGKSCPIECVLLRKGKFTFKDYILRFPIKAAVVLLSVLAIRSIVRYTLIEPLIANSTEKVSELFERTVNNSLDKYSELVDHAVDHSLNQLSKFMDQKNLTALVNKFVASNVQLRSLYFVLMSSYVSKYNMSG